MLIKTNANNTVPPCYLSSYGASYSLTPSRSKKNKTVGQKSGCEVQNHTTRIKPHYENWDCIMRIEIMLQELTLQFYGFTVVNLRWKLCWVLPQAGKTHVQFFGEHLHHWRSLSQHDLEMSLLEVKSLLQWQQQILRNDFLGSELQERWTHHIERLSYMCLLHHDFEAWIGSLDSSRRRRWARRKLSCWRTSLLPPPSPWRCWFWYASSRFLRFDAAKTIHYMMLRLDLLLSRYFQLWDCWGALLLVHHHHHCICSFLLHFLIPFWDCALEFSNNRSVCWSSQSIPPGTDCANNGGSFLAASILIKSLHSKLWVTNQSKHKLISFDQAMISCKWPPSLHKTLEVKSTSNSHRPSLPIRSFQHCTIFETVTMLFHKCTRNALQPRKKIQNKQRMTTTQCPQCVPKP